MKHSGEIRAIAVPAIVSNLTTPILGLVDVAVTGHIGNAVYLGAIALGGTVFNMLYWLFGFLRMGTSGLTAQAYGATDSRRQALLFWRSMVIAVAIGCMLVALARPVGDIALHFMDADDATAALARRYFNIVICGAPAVMMGYALAGWFIGMQNTRAAMWMAIAINVVNIALSLALVYGAGWKIAGVATGTMSAQWIGAIIGLVIVWRRYKPAPQPLETILERSELAKFFHINADIFLRTCCLVAVTVWFTHAGAIQGTTVLAANALLLQFFMLFSYFIDGYAYAGEALAGKYAGAADTTSLGTLIKALMRKGLMFALIFTTIYLIGGRWFVAWLSSDANVIATARTFVWWAAAIPLAGFGAFVWDGIFVGLTRTRAMLLSLVVALVVFFAFYFALRATLGNHALWLAFTAYLAARGITEAFLYKKCNSR